MKKISNLIINFDYCGICAGNCQGCLLSTEERKTFSAFLNFDKVQLSINELLISYDYQNIIVDNLVIAFGRGNTLYLTETDWEQIKLITEKILLNIQHVNHVIECSTGLVGKIDTQIELAKKWTTFMSEFNLRFVVVANADLYSNQYWNNLDLFFKTMMQFRIESNFKHIISTNNKNIHQMDNTGDILNFNLYSNNLPNVNLILDKVKQYQFPVNITLLPFYRNATIIKNGISLQSNIKNQNIYNLLSDWLLSFYNKSKEYQLDANFINLIEKDIEEFSNGINFDDAVQNANHNQKQFFWIQKTGLLTRGSFSVFGDIDFERLNTKLNKNFNSNPSQMILSFMKIKQCQKCKFNTVCIKNSTYVQSLLNYDSLSSTSCPNGLLKTYEHIFDKN